MQHAKDWALGLMLGATILAGIIACPEPQPNPTPQTTITNTH